MSANSALRQPRVVWWEQPACGWNRFEASIRDGGMERGSKSASRIGGTQAECPARLAGETWPWTAAEKRADSSADFVPLAFRDRKSPIPRNAKDS